MHIVAVMLIPKRAIMDPRSVGQGCERLKKRNRVWNFGVGVKYQEHTRFRLITFWQFAAKWVMQSWQKRILFHQNKVMMKSVL
ncbi:hypothetical protein ACE34P_001106 [Vibrio fluvialis]